MRGKLYFSPWARCCLRDRRLAIPTASTRGRRIHTARRSASPAVSTGVITGSGRGWESAVRRVRRPTPRAARSMASRIPPGQQAANRAPSTGATTVRGRAWQSRARVAATPRRGAHLHVQRRHGRDGVNHLQVRRRLPLRERRMAQPRDRLSIEGVRSNDETSSSIACRAWNRKSDACVAVAGLRAADGLEGDSSAARAGAPGERGSAQR